MGRFFLVVIAGISIVGFTLSGCRTVGIQDVPVMPQTEPARLMQITLDTLDSVYLGIKKKKLVADFYKGRGFVPAWCTAKDTAAGTLVDFIRKARYYGLLPGDYHLAALDSLANNQSLRAERVLRRDALLTDAFFGLAEDLRSGRLYTSSKETDSLALALLHHALGQGRLVESLQSQEPDFSGYHALKEGLKVLLNEAAVAGREHNLLSVEDTRESPVLQKRIQSVEINLERWRQEDSRFGDWYIYVNIPSYTVRVVEHDSVVLESRAIVGKPTNATPALSSTVQCFVTYPYWHVPRRISVEEFLPRIKKDTSFIRRNNFDVLNRKGRVLHPDSVAWDTFHKDNFPVVLRQREGSENSLGIVKFVFDNPYAVFLHDTNAPSLFHRKDRALSHGCVRVEKAVVLAHYLATGRIDRESAVVSKYLKEKTRHTIELPVSVPIHLRYFTAELIDGQLRVYEDIYSRDQKLMDLMYPAGTLPNY